MIQKTSIPFKVMIPGVVGFLTLAIKRGIRYSLLLPQKLEPGILHNEILSHSTLPADARYEPELLADPVDAASNSIGEIFSGSFNDYLIFMLVLLLVNMLIYGSGLLRASFAKEERQKRKSLSQYSRDEILHIMKSLIKAIITYSLIYCSFQIMCAVLALIFDSTNLLQRIISERSFSQNIRVLDQEEEPFLLDQYDNIKRPSLSIGKVMSQLDISGYSVQLSKDETKAFVVGNFPPTLKILDISDSEFPVILSSFSLVKGRFDRFYKSLIFSQDETKLFISNYEYLQIIDISNLKSPVDIATVRDEYFVQETIIKSIVSDLCKTSLAISTDAKYLFAAGFGLQIFDISNVTNPIILNSTLSQKNQGRLLPSSASLSQDGKKLFYSDGSLWVYDVTNPTKGLKILSSFNATNPITSMILSKNSKIGFVIGIDPRYRIFLQKLDTSDIFSIKESKIFNFTNASLNRPIFLDHASDSPFLSIGFQELSPSSWHTLLIFDTIEERTLVSDRMLVNGALSLAFTKDYKKVILGFLHKFKIVDLYLDFPNQNAFGEASNIINSYETDSKSIQFRLSHSNKSLAFSIKNIHSEGMFRVHKIPSQQEEGNKFIDLSSYETPKEIHDMAISEDDQRAFLLTLFSIYIVDISNPENITLLGRYLLEENNTISSFVLSRDGKTGYMTSFANPTSYLSALDFSDPTKPTNKSTTVFNKRNSVFKPILSKDERTLFFGNNDLFVYNISDPFSPVLLTNLTLQTDGYGAARPPQTLLSPDGKTLYFADNPEVSSGIIHIIDVTDVRSPELRSELATPALQSPFSKDRLCAISPDSRTFYFARPGYIAVIDVSNLNSPRSLGNIPIFNSSSGNQIIDLTLSTDGKKAFIFTYLGVFLISSLQPEYSTFMTQDTLLLGERYNIDLFVIQMNKYLSYNRMEADYRLTKIAVVEPSTIAMSGAVEKTTPSWMIFDSKSQILTIEPRRKSDIGTYRIYVEFSTKLAIDAFSGVVQNKSEDVLTTLVSLGYLDNQLFLTEKFGGLKDFLLPSSYEEYKKAIYEVLTNYTFGTFNELKVVPSLNVIDSMEKLKIDTASLANLKVQISLLGENLNQAKFLSRNYASIVPVITQNKSRLIIEGSLKDINLALEEIVISLPDEISSCAGEITIDDKLNPIITQFVKNISKYFSRNLPPRLNKEFPLTIQEQVQSKPVSTGQFFQIKLDQSSFSDNYTFVENLHYSMVFVQDQNETVLPSWLSFSDMTLTGTAPEQILHRDFEFKLVVKNEFQEYKEPFTLHVRISSSFVLKLLIKYSPYVLSIVGLLISANKIYNVVLKGNYKHSKDFYVKTGEEVTSEVIFPVSFIREENQEAMGIMMLLEKKIGNQKKLFSSFMSQGKLDKVKIVETIKNELNELSVEEQQSKFDLYFGGESQCQIVNQIIINKITMMVLNSNEEKETRNYFEKIKKQWPDFVEWDLVNSCFKIKKNLKFEKIDAEETVLISGDEESSSLSESFVKKSKINQSLIEDAILAYSFDCQNIDILPVSIEIKVKERVKTNSLRRFLKLDLKDFPFSEKGKIGYGIGYRKKYNTVFFNGVVESDIRNKTLVVQITNRKQKILKELWIFGMKQEMMKNKMNNSEVLAKGKEYEIF